MTTLLNNPFSQPQINQSNNIINNNTYIALSVIPYNNLPDEEGIEITQISDHSANSKISKNSSLLDKIDFIIEMIEASKQEDNVSLILQQIFNLRILNKHYTILYLQLLEWFDIGIKVIFKWIEHKELVIKQAVLLLLTETNLNNKSSYDKDYPIERYITRICSCLKHKELEETTVKCLVSFFELKINSIAFEEIVEYFYLNKDFKLESDFILTNIYLAESIFKQIISSVMFSCNYEYYIKGIILLLTNLLDCFAKFKNHYFRQVIFLYSSIILGYMGDMNNFDKFIDIFIPYDYRKAWKAVIVEEKDHL